VNYRHAFHAGNFADVLKHVVLTRILTYLMRKDSGLFYLDTHAGVGRYALDSDEARRGGEWREGVGRVLAAAPPDDIAGLLEPWLAAIGKSDESGTPAFYPGSPLVAASLLRPQDRLTLCELHEADHRELNANMRRDAKARTMMVKALHIDGYTALKAFVPPKERRGLALIDPPFESRDEFPRMTSAIAAAWRKWPSGCYALWYPIKHEGAVGEFQESLGQAGITNILHVQLATGAIDPDRPLTASGMAIINPPYVLEPELAVIGPWLCSQLARDEGAFWRMHASLPTG
jgi:23S rRNA (adenine2030-N6)-methyltransferase